MKVTTFGKVGVTVGAAALLVGALAVPAQADPASGSFGTLVGLGSDTTQDVMNGMAAASNGNIASYDATLASTTVQTRAGGPTNVPRASGSGAGRDLLRTAIGQTSSVATIAVPGGTAPVNSTNSIGQIDFARSSGGPDAASVQQGSNLTYIPFARDAVTVAVAPTSPLAVVPWVKGTASVTGQPSLYNVYRGDVKFAYVSGTAGSYAYVGVGATAAAAPSGSTAYAIQAILPKSGSGTRSYFIGQLGLTETDVTNLKANGTIIDSLNGTPIEEHDGTAIVASNANIGPFSISQWVAQANAVTGVTDRRHGAILETLDGTAPTTGSGTAYATNASFSSMVRDVYNIVPSRYADDAASNIHATFVGTSSFVCSNSAIITKYGFQTMPNNSAAETCGSTTLRAYAAQSGAQVSLTPASSTVGLGDDATFTASISGDLGQGGTVYVVDNADPNGELAHATVAKGSTSVSISVPTSEIGTQTVHAEFVAALPGLAGATSGNATLTTTASDVSVLLSTSTTATVGKSKSVIVWVDGVDANGGTVTLKDGETTISTATIGAGESAAAFSFYPTKTSYNLIASYAAPSGSTTGSGTSVAKAITVAKGAVTITVPTVHTTTKARAKVTVTIGGTPTPTGTVTIKEGTKTLLAAKAISGGKLSAYIPLLSKGTHHLTIVYTATGSLWTSQTKTTGLVGVS